MRAEEQAGARLGLYNLGGCALDVLFQGQKETIDGFKAAE